MRPPHSASPPLLHVKAAAHLINVPAKSNNVTAEAALYKGFYYFCAHISYILTQKLNTMTKRYRALAIAVLSTFTTLLCGVAVAQPATVSGETARLLGYMKHAMLFNNQTPQEKVYLHLDNTGYFQGETMWFSAYVTRCSDGKPTDISSVLYVELINPGGDIIRTRKLHIDNGLAHGDIKLDSIYGSGFYEVRAYTRYMTNWGNLGLFSRVVPIFKKPAREGDYSKKVIDEVGYKNRLPNYRSDGTDADGQGQTVQKKGLKVQFYPEGGSLVKGLTCRLAFLVTSGDNALEDGYGELVSEDGTTLANFTTAKGGRGVVGFVPDDEPKYLRINDADGKEFKIKVPDALDSGCSLTLDALKDGYITANISSTPDFEGKMLGYVVTHGGRILVCDTIRAESAMALKFERDGLPEGVNDLVLFDSNGNIHADRLFFIYPQPSAADSIDVYTAAPRLSPCGKVKLNLKARPNASISLSAMDVETMTNGAEGNARTWTLLSSEVKGYIAQPDYYFESDDREHRMNADLLMMVQGWRRHNWRLLSGSAHFKKIQQIEDRLYLFGSVVPTKKKNPVDGIELNATLYNQEGYSLKGSATTDSTGNYAFSLPDVSGEWKLLISTQLDGKATNYRVKINRHFSPSMRSLSPGETAFVPPFEPNLLNSKNDSIVTADFKALAKREHLLPEVKIKAKRRWTEGARAAWESERQGQHWASVYYDIDEANDKAADEGLVTPSLYEWLSARNPLFGSQNKDNYYGTEENIEVDGSYTTRLSNEQARGNFDAPDMEADNSKRTQEDVENASSANVDPRLFVDGMAYKNRPIIWILNNAYYQMTNVGIFKPSSLTIFRETHDDMPTFIDEVKAVYISERSDAFQAYLSCPDIMGKNPVTIFVYTHHSFPLKVKGLRRTHFYGYDDPSTFEMEDYSVLPPMEDYRRTIFWTPDLKTDAEGNATVEFYNNSTAKKIHVSAEGMTTDGNFLINE